LIDSLTQISTRDRLPRHRQPHSRRSMPIDQSYRLELSTILASRQTVNGGLFTSERAPRPK
jgi:hypothetical protein